MNTPKMIIASLVAVLSACASTPSTITQQSINVAPQRTQAMRENNGAIFQTASYRPLFEDQKARLVGDVLTIVINESTSAGKAAANSGSKTGSVAFSAPTVFGLKSTTTAQGSLAASSSDKFEEKGAATNSNTFTGTITVTVIDVLGNGNLLVSGEKQIALNKGAEFVRFSGVINPRTITASNTVSSGQVADARFEYRSTSQLDKAELSSMLARFFFSFLPL